MAVIVRLQIAHVPNVIAINFNITYMKFFNRQHKQRTIIGFFFCVVTAMAFMPYGSFDPRQVGFWLSIAFAIMTTVGTNWLMLKFSQPIEDRDQPKRE